MTRNGLSQKLVRASAYLTAAVVRAFLNPDFTDIQNPVFLRVNVPSYMN